MESHFHYTTANYHRPLKEVQVTEFFGSVSDVKGLQKRYPFAGLPSRHQEGLRDMVREVTQTSPQGPLHHQLEGIEAAESAAVANKQWPSSTTAGAGRLSTVRVAALDWQVLGGLCGVCSLVACLAWLEGNRPTYVVKQSSRECDEGRATA
jgi:hypothetical protein